MDARPSLKSNASLGNRRRSSKLSRTLTGLNRSVSTEIIADREQGRRLSTLKLAQGAQERQSICVQGAAFMARQLNSDLEKGLSSKRAEELLQDHGPNEIQKAEAKSIMSIVIEQINVLNMLVMFGGVMCFVQGTFKINGIPFGEEPDYFNGTILFVIVGVCIVVGAYMEWSCSRVMADVSNMSALTCTVIRDGCQSTLPSEKVVPGDIVVLRLGDAIPADCIVVEAADLQTNEIALTGEPYEISKSLLPKDPTSPFPSNLLYASTGVVNGSGKGLVLQTGMKTEIGKIAALLVEEDVGLTSVQRTMNSIGALITIIVICLTAGIFSVSYYMRVNDPSDPCPEDDDICFLQKSIMRALFAAVGAIPESLHPACTFLLVMGCTTLKSLNAATLKLAAVDTIGACSYICSDKTGTLTEGMMTCMQLHLRVRDENQETLHELGSCVFYPTQGFNPRGGVFNKRVLTTESMALLDRAHSSTALSLSSDAMTADTELPTDLGDPENTSSEARLVHSCMMALFLNCYGTALVEKDGSHSIQGNMSEGALIVAAAKARISGPEAHATYQRLPKVELPFSSARKMMATVHKLPENSCLEAIQFDKDCKYVAIIKGAPEVVLPHLSKVLVAKADGTLGVDDGKLNGEDTAWFARKNEEMSTDALRVLCVAVRPLTIEELEQVMEAESNADERAQALLEGPSKRSPLVFMGVVGLMDPPRPSARAAVEECHKAGIRVAMITGDQTPTAVAVAKDLGILPNDGRKGSNELLVSECSALKRLQQLDGADAAIDEMCERVVVWSRAQPRDKVTIVESLQRQRHIVAMTGDGVNDAGALKKADIGLAMGIAGTDVTKSAADIILMDDRFASIFDAASEGRRIFGNIQRLSAYMLCCNIFDVVVMMGVMTLGWAVPLEQAQLFKANFITHMFYPWCMVFQPASFYNMMHPPRSRDKPLLPALTRRVVIPIIFAAYFFLMLSAQYAGAMIYVGTVNRDEQTGTSSINDFYSDKGFVCLYANTMRMDQTATNAAKQKSDGNPVTIFYDRDAAPLHCRIRKLMLSGWKEVSEYGRHDKENPDEAIGKAGFHWFTGSWGDTFDIKNSWLSESLQGPAKNFQDKQWKDAKQWLEKCSDSVIGGHGESVNGDSDKLCWKDCNGMPCWKRDLGAKDAVLGPHKAANEAAVLKEEGNSHSSNKKDEEDEPVMKPVLYKKFNVGSWGVRQMRSLVLLTMVLIEFAMLYCFATHEFSLPLLGLNMAFPIAWVPMLAVLLSFIYLPVFVIDQGFAPLDGLGILVALSLVVAFYTIFELTKVLHRSIFDEELQEKTVLARLLSEGLLHAFPSREEAWMKCPKRRPLLSKDDEVGYGGCEDQHEAIIGNAPMITISSGSSTGEQSGDDAV